MNFARTAHPLLLAAALLLPDAAPASDALPPTRGGKAARPAASAASAAVVTEAAEPDPMDRLRQRLAERLNTGKSVSTGAQTELRVTNRPSVPAAATEARAEPPAAVRGTVLATAERATPVAPQAAQALPVAASNGPLNEIALTARVAAPRGLTPVSAHMTLPVNTSPTAAAMPSPAPVATVATVGHREAAPVTARRSAPAAERAAASAHGHGDAPHWDYTGPAGPQTWGGLRPEFGLCGTGQRQSPIDIRGGLAVDLEPVRFDYKPSSFSVIDNGHTVQANLASGNVMELGGRRFELLQLHFHRPSEERIDGRQFEMSVHLVHRDEQGRLAVVAILLDKGPTQPAVQKVWNSLPLEKNEDLPARVQLDVRELIPADTRYYTYMGSLTTPPCSEGVQWVVMRQPVAVAPEQVELFARMYPMNARPVQQVAGRRILQSQ